MVIQRWQSLLLLLATVFTGITCCLPFASEAVADCQTSNIYLTQAPVLLVLDIAVAILLFLTIFLYKNLRLQMTMAKVAAALIAVSVISTALTCYFTAPTACFNWLAAAMPAAALICTILAHRFMGKDKKLLSSYDRLR